MLTSDDAGTAAIWVDNSGVATTSNLKRLTQSVRLLGVVFAAQSLWLYRIRSVPSVAAATLTTVFGLWFMAAPLLYDVGFLATAGTQFGGLLVAAFALYVLVSALSTPD
ncbi:hypothetical protein [Salinigranum marinum]|uniref:hypothetical protein n=1 Tax=Salinigranum marinum TaxID=1515595 RepID=UPI002989DB17|nr:hypothetical protein [Salinigranum marinum]